MNVFTLTCPATFKADWLKSASGTAGLPEALTPTDPEPPVIVKLPVDSVPSAAMGMAATAFWSSFVMR